MGGDKIETISSILVLIILMLGTLFLLISVTAVIIGIFSGDINPACLIFANKGR